MLYFISSMRCIFEYKNNVKITFLDKGQNYSSLLIIKICTTFIMHLDFRKWVGMENISAMSYDPFLSQIWWKFQNKICRMYTWINNINRRIVWKKTQLIYFWEREREYLQNGNAFGWMVLMNPCTKLNRGFRDPSS